MADHLYAAALEAALSTQRLERYRQPGDGPFDHLGRYFWNMALGEAAYPALHQLEVALRNSFHEALSDAFGPTWFEDAEVLLPEELTKVADARARLVGERKDANDPGRIVAEMTFAFWTGLLSGPHANMPKPLWPAQRERVFPYIDVGMRRGFTRGIRDVRRQFHRIRSLRNRVSHHEPIWRRWTELGQAIVLRDVYRETLGALGWISPELVEVTEELARFDEVLAGGRGPISALVITLAGRYQARAARGES